MSVWFISQSVDVRSYAGGPIYGHVYGATKGGPEHVRLIVSEHYDSTWSTIYDSGWVHSDRTWTRLSCICSGFDPNSDLIDFKMDARKAYDGHSVGTNAGLNDAYLGLAYPVCIPAPGVLVLGTTGMGIVGWFCRRGTL